MGLRQVIEGGPGNDQELRRLAGPRRSGARRVKRKRELSEEVSRIDHGDLPLLPMDGIDDGHSPRQHHIESVGRRPLLEHRLSRREAAEVGRIRQAAQRPLVQSGEVESGA